jgi:predicted N-acetyltransferase YhbS
MTSDPRPMRSTDIPALDALLRDAYRSNNDFLTRLQIARDNPRVTTVVVDGADGPIGMGTLYDYVTMGYVAMMAVAPQAQRRGIGRRVLAQLIARSERLGHRALGLEATVAGERLYAQFGFRNAGMTIGFDGASASGPVAPGIVRATEDDADAIAAYDLQAFGGDRTASVRAWLSDPAFAMLVERADGRIVGYGAFHGTRIGPLLADDATHAALLFDALRSLHAFERARISVPAENGAATALVAARGWTRVAEHAHMVRGDAFYLPRRKLYALTSLGEG